MTRHSWSFAGSVFTAATVARRPLLPTEPVLNTVPYFSSRARFMSSLVATRGFSAGAGGSGAGVGAWWVLVGVVACGAGTGSGAGSGAVSEVVVSCFALSRAVLTATAMRASTSTGLVGAGVGSGVTVAASSLVEASMLPRSSSPFWLLRVVVVWCARLVLVWRRRLIAERLYSLVVMGLVFFLGWFAGCFSCVVYSCFGAMFWVYSLFLF